MELRNAHWSGKNQIDAEAKHPTYGWLPITLSATDPATSELYRRALETTVEPSPEAPIPVDPPPPVDIDAARQLATLGKPELLFALTEMGIVSEIDAIAAVSSGAVPEAFSAAVEAMPANERLMARLKWAGDAEVHRMNPLVIALGTAVFGPQATIVLDQLFKVGGAANG